MTFTPRLLSIVFFLQPAGDLPEGIIVPPPVNGTDEDYADYIDSQQDSFRSGGPVQANASPDFDNNPDQVGRFNPGLFYKNDFGKNKFRKKNLEPQYQFLREPDSLELPCATTMKVRRRVIAQNTLLHYFKFVR